MAGKPKIVATNPVFPETRALLEECATVEVNPRLEPWTYEEARQKCRDAAGLLAFMTDRIDAKFLAACPHLRVIGAALKGSDNIDVQAATDAGIWLTIVPDLLTVPTAELAIGLMLSLGRNIVAGDRKIRKHGFHGWRAELYGAGIADSTVGIVGFGLVGRAIAERLTAFQCRLKAYDLAIGTVVDAVRGGNSAVGGRLIEFGGSEYMVRGNGYAKSVADFENIVVKANENGCPLIEPEVEHRPPSATPTATTSTGRACSWPEGWSKPGHASPASPGRRTPTPPGTRTARISPR